MSKQYPAVLLQSCALFLAVAALGAGPLATQVRGATDYPNRPVRIVVPQPAGGGVDIYTRAISQKLTESWGQQVLVDNRPGANGIIALEQVIKAKPDGYTLVAAFTSVLTINPHVYKSLPYDTFRDLAAITQTVSNTMVLVVNPSLPARSVKQLVALGKARPGDLNYGSFGIGNLTHLAGELFRLEAGLKMVHVPYKGETPAITEAMSGQVALLFATSVGVAGHVKAGRLRMLATAGEKRTAAFPDIPTMVESGLPRVVVTGWGGTLAPAGTPREVLEKVQRDTARNLQGGELRERLAGMGSEPIGSTPDQFAAFLRSETDKWERVAKVAGIYKSQ
jgi:tripartite-type tricarboxylate transporter receptor subunit TctC